MFNGKTEQEEKLWQCVQEWAWSLNLSPVKELLMIHGGRSGMLSSLAESQPGPSVPGDTPGDFPPAAGWGARDIRVSFDGQVREVTGYKRKFMRCLIHFRGRVVTDRTLRLWVWGDTEVSDGRIRDVAHQARQFLRALVGCNCGVDPIERVEGGYRLGI